MNSRMENCAFEAVSPSSKVSSGSSTVLSPYQPRVQSRNSSRISLDSVSSGDFELIGYDEVVPFETMVNNGTVLGPTQLSPMIFQTEGGAVVQYSPHTLYHLQEPSSNVVEGAVMEEGLRYVGNVSPWFDWRFENVNPYPLDQSHSLVLGESQLLLNVCNFVGDLLSTIFGEDIDHCQYLCNTIKALNQQPEVSLVGKITVPPPEAPRTCNNQFHSGMASLKYELSFKDNCESEHRVKFCMLDRIGCFTLLEGDGIQFQLTRVMSTNHKYFGDDRNRNGFILRPKNITLADEYIVASGESRMTGVIYHVVPPQRYGFLLCSSQHYPSKLFFRFDEFLDPEVIPYLGQHVEFTIMHDAYHRFNRGKVAARRIKALPFGYAKFGIEIARSIGVVLSLPIGPSLTSAACEYVRLLHQAAQQMEDRSSSPSCADSHPLRLPANRFNSMMVRSYYDLRGNPGYILHGRDLHRDRIRFYWNTCIQIDRISVGCKVRMSLCHWNPLNDFVAFNVEVEEHPYNNMVYFPE